MIVIKLKDEGVSAALGRVEAALGDLTPVMREIGEALTVSTEDRLRRGVTPDGTPFAPRSEATARSYERRKLRPRGGPLDLTGDMIAGIYARAGKTSVEVSSSATQSAVMHFGAAQGAFGRTSRGGPIPWGDIPARPFLGLSAEDRSSIYEIAAERLAGA